MRTSKMVGKVFFVLIPLLFSIAGCSTSRPRDLMPGNSPGTAIGVPAVTQSPLPHTEKTSHYFEVTKSDYDEAAKEVRIEVQSVNESELENSINEEIFDKDNPEGVVNFATAQFPDKDLTRVRVKHTASGTELFNLSVNTDAQDGNTVHAEQATGTTSIKLPPPGVKMDAKIRPLASLKASRQAKVAAIRKIAESKLGMRYVWGHNEDRGQVGFDCSNYTAYVYHHALGYSFSTMSRRQYSLVGIRVPIRDMRPGDLLTFDLGRHVGIYMGNGKMIQMGGGTGKCTYLSVGPGSYWYRHLSAVKRMF